ncbi:hypothetical protein GOBAR_AA03600 [Gossypium barbadense]|uniref:Uncharacterized protein n=1 Tax=Gossypium barbadense TaxID=3634 RepID=A0A2P5YN01_GOSBA|nr:hypothetical protein GOBAR_AA03600 [Gossypium barbadense]
MKLLTQCNENSFEVEKKLVDNCILQEQLQIKCSENEELHSKEIKSNVQLSEENSVLYFQNKKSTEEASYATELTSLKNVLEKEVTKERKNWKIRGFVEKIILEA